MILCQKQASITRYIHRNIFQTTAKQFRTLKNRKQQLLWNWGYCTIPNSAIDPALSNQPMCLKLRNVRSISLSTQTFHARSHFILKYQGCGVGGKISESNSDLSKIFDFLT